MAETKLIPFLDDREFTRKQMVENSAKFYLEMRKRRTIRHFSSQDVSQKIIESCIKTASTAPNGANLQPWHFVVIKDAKIKKKIRLAAEKEEKAFYESRAPKEWLEALEPLGTDWKKPFLEDAPYLIAIFSQSYGLLPNGKKVKNYYVQESVGIATGMLITALHKAGLASLTHTPSPMGFLNEILNRPVNEKPFLLLVVGFPAEDAMVPVIQKKSLQEISTFI